MIAVFPECAVAFFPLIVFLPTAAGDQLHAIGNNVWTGVSNQKVNVVARHDVIKYRKTEALLRFVKPSADKTADRAQTSVENPSMATVSDVPDLAGQEMAIGARHRLG
jgi:hypothetical protein